MAEPAGLLIEAGTTENELASFFERVIAHDGAKARVGHVLSKLLDSGDEYCDVLIVSHDARRDRLFIAWILNHYDAEALAPIWPVLDALADCLGPDSTAEGLVASTLPACLASVRIEGGRVVREPGEPVRQPLLDRLTNKFWSFASNDVFPDAAGSMRLRNHQCGAFKTAWKTYLKWRECQERPARIAAATEAEPYRLFGNIYCWDGRVFERDRYTGRDIEFPGADPLTFRTEAGYLADRSHVWRRQLAQGSPPESIPHGRYTINNPDAIWEHQVIPNVVGANFTWLYDRLDTMFWTDGRRIYSLDRDMLVPLPDVLPSEFQQYGQCFGTDGKSVFWFAKKLPLNPERLRTESYFIWDDEKVFQCATELPLRGKEFRILGEKYVSAKGGSHYRLADLDKTIIWGPNETASADDPSFWSNSEP